MSEAVSYQKFLREWVQSVALHTRPERIHWCDGGEVERYSLERELACAGTLRELDLERHPRSFVYQPVGAGRGGRSEMLVATRSAQDARQTNNWVSSDMARDVVWPLFAGAMAGRTMYVVPYLLGPPMSAFTRVGVQLTDSPYAVLGLRTMAKVGRVALDHIDSCGPFVRGLHSVGHHASERRFLVHWPEELEIWSFGTDAALHSVLSHRHHSLRLAGAQASKQGWLAESMALLAIRSPAGQTRFVAAALPRGCGKTELAMLAPSLPGWTVEALGDSVCWMRPGRDGRLWAVNPESGTCGAAHRLSERRSPSLRHALSRDVLFESAPGAPSQWDGIDSIERDPGARFMVSTPGRPGARDAVEGSRGVPLSAILFGARRSTVVPLVYEARSWEHGVYVGTTMATEGEEGVVHCDPMGMLDVRAHDLGSYLANWLKFGRKLTRAPRIFHVNWFRTNEAGQLLWPGFGENIRVLKWILERVEGVAARRYSPIGFIPSEGALDTSGLSLSDEVMPALGFVDCEAWQQELERTRHFFARFEGSLPSELRMEHAALSSRLSIYAN